MLGQESETQLGDRASVTPVPQEGIVSEEVEIPNGEALAAIMAAGIGSMALGLFTTLAEAWPAFRTFLTFSNPVGPLSGKTLGAVIVWLVAWGVLHFMWRGRQLNFARTLTISLVLIALGVIGTFPIFFEAFAPS